MPLVTIKVTGKPVTQEQKETLISGTTDLIVDILGKQPETTWVIIEEVSQENWAWGGKSVAQRESSLK